MNSKINIYTESWPWPGNKRRKRRYILNYDISTDMEVLWDEKLVEEMKEDIIMMAMSANQRFFSLVKKHFTLIELVSGYKHTKMSI